MALTWLAAGAGSVAAAPAVPQSCTKYLPAAECQALNTVYNTLGGSGWTNHAGWLTDSNPCVSWYGVACGYDPATRLYWVTYLTLVSNNLTGTLPTELTALTKLLSLDLSTNRLTGGIPASLGTMQKLQFLGLRGNQLTGRIPAELGNLPALKELWLNNNRLTGGIPADLGQLIMLQKLLLERNPLGGSILSIIRGATLRSRMRPWVLAGRVQ